MTNVEISYGYETAPDEAVMRGIDNIREVYGIRKLKFEEPSRRISVEYDATRLTPATIVKLLRQAGLDLK
jgi:copper chaperone CopZ